MEWAQAGIAYKYIRGLNKTFTLRSRTIKDAQYRPIDDTDEIRETWRGYTESLYTKDQTIHAEWLAIPSIVVDPVPAVLPAEVTKTIRHINNNKAPGSDDLNIELIKAIDDDSKMMARLTHLCNQIITEGKWPAEFRGSICQVTHVTDLMFIMFLCLFNNQIVSVAHSRVTFWLPPRCEPV